MDAHYIGNLLGLAAPKLAHQPVVDLAPLGAASPPHVGVTPTSDNAPWQGRVEGTEKAVNTNFASDSANGKALSTVTARASLCACTLHEMTDSSFLVAKWNCSKAVPCLRAVGDLLRQIGGK